MDEDKSPQSMPSDSRSSESGQGCLLDGPPGSETVPEAAPVYDPIDEIHGDPRGPAHHYEEVTEAAASSIPTPSSEKVQDDISSLHTNIVDNSEDPVPTVADASTSSLVIPGPALSVPRTPKRSASHPRSRSRSRSLSPSLLSSPLTCLSSSPISEEETRQSTPESDVTDAEIPCTFTKTSVKRRSIGAVDGRAFKKSKLETVSTVPSVDIQGKEQPASELRRKTAKKPACSPSPPPCLESLPVSVDMTASSNATNSRPTDQNLVGMVVEALAMTRASSMDVESIRKIVVVCFR